MSFIGNTSSSLLEHAPLMWRIKPTEIYLLDHNYCLRPGNYKNNRDKIKASRNPWVERADILENEYEDNGINQMLDPSSSKGELLITTPKAFGLKRKLKTKQSVRVRLKKEPNNKPKGNLNEDEYKCSTCFYISDDRNIFRMHLSKHRLLNLKINEGDVDLTQENDFKCKKCNFKTEFIHCFKYHLKQHDVEVTSGNDFSNTCETEEDAKGPKGNDDINNQFCYQQSLKIHKNKADPSEKSSSPKNISTLVDKSSLTITEACTVNNQNRLVIKEITKHKEKKSTHKNYVLESNCLENIKLSAEKSEKSAKKINQNSSICLKSHCPEDVKLFAENPFKLLMTEVGSIDNQLVKESSAESKESNQMIEMYVLDLDSTENVDPFAETTFNLKRSDPHTHTLNSKCSDLVTKYQKYYLDMSQDVQIYEIENSAKTNKNENDIQEECKIVPVRISELFSKKVEDFACLERRSLDNQNVLIPQETLEPNEANCKVHDRMNPSSEPFNPEPEDQPKIQLQESNEHKTDSNKFKCHLCDFVSNYKKYLCLHMSKHEKPVKLRWHKERKKTAVKVGRCRRSKNPAPIDMNKSYTGFKCYEKNCHFIANIKEYLDLHLEKHLKPSQSSSNNVISKIVPNLVLQEQQQNNDTVYETLQGFKCNSCHFITNSKEYMELHIKEHQPFPELGHSENVKNVDNTPSNPPSCTTYSKNQLNMFSNDSSSDVSKPYRTYRCKKCDFSTHFVKFFKVHLDKHTTEALQPHVNVFSDHIPKGINNQLICNKVTEKKHCTKGPVDLRNCNTLTKSVEKNIDICTSVISRTEELDFPEVETYNKICQIMDAEDCDIDHNQVINDNANGTISDCDQGNYYRCELCDFSTHFEEYLELHVRKHTCDIDKQSNFKVFENFHSADNFDNEINELFLKKEMNMWERLDPYIHKTLEEASGYMCTSKRSHQFDIKVDQLQEPHFSTIQEYWLHLEENNLDSVSGKDGSKTKMFQCEYCNYTTKFEKNMTRHENYHILNKAYKCKKCKFSTNFTKFFEVHLESHKESHISNECMNLEDFSKSEIPGNISMPGRAYTCKKCDFSTNFTRFFEAHLEFHISNTPEYPNGDGSSKSEMAGNISTPDRPYKCKKCDFSTHFIRFFNAHLEAHLPKQPEHLDMDCSAQISTISDKTYKCKKCDFSTHFIGIFEAHIEKHYIQEYMMDSLWIHEEIR